MNKNELMSSCRRLKNKYKSVLHKEIKVSFPAQISRVGAMNVDRNIDDRKMKKPAGKTSTTFEPNVNTFKVARTFRFASDEGHNIRGQREKDSSGWMHFDRRACNFSVINFSVRSFGCGLEPRWVYQ